MSGAEEQRFADSHPLRLFPTFVWRVELADNVRARVNASVLKAVEELRTSLPPLKRGEGWQSRQNLHRRAPFSEGGHRSPNSSAASTQRPPRSCTFSESATTRLASPPVG
jgi:hypothetical protein